MLNVFNVQDLCACGADVFNNGGGVALTRIGSGVLTPVNTPSLAAFNPFTTTPEQGVNWSSAQLRPRPGTRTPTSCRGRFASRSA